MKTRMVMLALVSVGAIALARPAGAQEAKRERDRITRAEIEGSAQRDQDIYQVVRSLRPHFLQKPRGVRSLGGTTGGSTLLYVDGVRESDLGQLKAIPAAVVEEVRYLDPTRSEMEYGSDAQGGAVVVKRLKSGSSTPAPVVPKDTTKPPLR